MKLRFAKAGFVVFFAIAASVFAATNVNADKWVADGKQQSQTGQYDQAIVSFNNALKFDRRNAPAYQGLGNCYWSKGNKTKALTYFKYSLQVNPDNAQLKVFVDSNSAAPAAAEEDKYLPMGNQYLKNRQYDYAIWAYNKSLEINPNNAKTLQALGNAYYAKGQKDKAIEAWDKSVAADPANTQLKTYVDNLRVKASTAKGSGSSTVSAPATGKTYLMVGSVVVLGALMFFFF